MTDTPDKLLLILSNDRDTRFRIERFKIFFSINSTLRRPLVPQDWFHGLLNCWLSLLNGFTFVSVFFRFQFSQSFSSSVIFSSLLLSTPIYPIFALFLGESASLSSFFSFRFHKPLVLMRWQVVSVFECNLCIVSYYCWLVSSLGLLSSSSSSSSSSSTTTTSSTSHRDLLYVLL